MSHPVDNDIEPGSINNYQTQHSYSSYPHPPPSAPLLPHQAQLPPQLPTAYQHQAQPPRPFQHDGHHSQQQQQQHPYIFGQVDPFTTTDNHINDHHPSSFPVLSPFTRPAFHHDNNPSYAAAAPPSAIIVPQVSQEQFPNGQTGAITTTTWGALGSETIPATATIVPQQKEGPIEQTTRGLTTTTIANSVTPSHQPPEEMRFIRAPLDILNAEQYDDGRFFSSNGKNGLSKPEARVQATTTPAPTNPKKRSRKASQNDQAEPMEEPKKARGRPRMTPTNPHEDMKARRKAQIRDAQRAYRERKELAIVTLEAKVERLNAGNAEVSAALESLLAEYSHSLNAQMPELARGLQRLQAAIAQTQAAAAAISTTKSESDEKIVAASKTNTTNMSPLAEDTAMQIDQPPALNQQQQQHMDDEAALTSSQVVLHQQQQHQHQHQYQQPQHQQPQQLFGGIIVTHEPETQVINRNSASALAATAASFDFEQFEDITGYTYIRMPHLDNASFRSPNQGYAEFDDFSQLPHWASSSLASQWEALPLPGSGAYMEGSLGRRLHRRMAERASRLLDMENPPYEVMHRVFGFVRSYEPLDRIRHRIQATLRRAADEELNIYTQPFHRIGGAGTHFPAHNSKTTAAAATGFQGGNGFGVGPYDERTMAVRDELLDVLQHTKIPGWQGEWFDAYEVQQVLSRSAITLPQGGGSGIIELPTSDFYDKSPKDEDNISSGSASPLVASSLRSSSTTNMNSNSLLRSSAAARKGTVVDVSSDAMAMHQQPVEQQQAMVSGNTQYPSPVSSVDNSILPAPAMAPDMWQSHAAAGSVAPGFLATMSSQTMAGHISPLLAYSHPHTHGHLDQHNATAAAPLTFSSNASQLGYTPPTSIDLINGHNRTKRVWFNEDKFIDSLGSKGTCVGRGPAFRKKDIVRAFWEAVEPATE